MLTFEIWHLAALAAIAVLAAVGIYAAGRTKRAESARMQAVQREARRSDEVARLTPTAVASLEQNTAAAMSNERLRARAHDLAAQLLLVADEWAGKSALQDGVPPSVEDGGPERRGAERLREEQRAKAKALYARIRHDVIDVRTAVLSRLDSRARPDRKAGIERAYEHPAGDDPFRDLADDLQLLADSLPSA